MSGYTSSMPAQSRSGNSGPAAAPRNRAAILASARRLFAEQGYRVPLNAIAKAAGVGQGVLYRHFPNRLTLAFEVFADNFAELERIAAETDGPESFHSLWHLVVDYTVRSVAFVEMVIEARAKVPESLGARRLEHLIAEPLARAQQAGLADPAWTPNDVLLLQRMMYGVVIAQSDTSKTMDDVRRALELIDPRLAPPIRLPEAQPRAT